MPKTLQERELDKHAPDAPLSFETVDNAGRCLTELRMAVGEVKRLIKARREGHALEVNGCTLALSSIERAQVFGMCWEGCLKKIKYWEFHVRRYVAIPKELERDMQAIRTEIDDYQNA